MIPTIIAFILKIAGSGAVDSILKYLETRANTDVQKAQIASLTVQNDQKLQAEVITTGMSHNWFWIPWLMATVPLAGWFGYGMINTIFPWLPHEAEVPPGLLAWAQIAWQNLFYSGGAVAGISILSNAIKSR